MNLIEKKLDAVMRCLTADNSADREQARKEIRDLQACIAPPGDRIEFDVRRILLDIGVPEHIKGYRYLVRAICLAAQKPELLGAITKGLYSRVADAFGTTKDGAERGIRHAIELAWDRCDLDTLKHYFGNTVSPTKGKPTNGEFVARISNVVR